MGGYKIDDERIRRIEFFHCSKVQQGFVKILVESLFSGYEGYLFLVHRLEVYLFIKDVHFYKYNALTPYANNESERVR